MEDKKIIILKTLIQIFEEDVLTEKEKEDYEKNK